MKKVVAGADEAGGAVGAGEAAVDVGAQIAEGSGWVEVVAGGTGDALGEIVTVGAPIDAVETGVAGVVGEQVVAGLALKAGRGGVALAAALQRLLAQLALAAGVEEVAVLAGRTHRVRRALDAPLQRVHTEQAQLRR